MQEARELANDPSPEYSAAPLEDDIFEWHCTLRGPAGTEFEGGLYHFRILLPAEYPFRPPSIMMLTPSGRFETDTKICISFTSYHEELWQPAWGVRTAIIGLQGFFPLKGKAAVGIGSIEHPVVERKRLAQLSRSWTCPICNEPNLALLPDPPGPNSVDSGRTLSSPSTTEKPAPPEPLAPVSASATIPDGVVPPAPDLVAAPQVINAPRTQTLQVKQSQRPPILLDTAICLILVLACGIVFRRMF
ncbi:UBC-like protein [Mycena olivaceomarginata]|nr:UBC-like protein [Mycena olivaceomarginata]